MTPGVRPLVAGNWKMNGLSGSLAEIDAIRQAADAGESGSAELLVCPPATLIAQAAFRIRGADLRLGGQDCYTEASGAFTGDISAAMLKDAGASYVIVGHSERRAGHGENDALVRAKAEAANNAGAAIGVVCAQLEASLPPRATPANLVVAYEPVWAIGTGLTPTAGDVGEMHRSIRQRLGSRYGQAGQGIRILYGGSG